MPAAVFRARATRRGLTAGAAVLALVLAGCSSGADSPDAAAPTGTQAPAAGTVGSGTVGSSTVGSGTVGSSTVVSGTVGSGTVGSGTVGSDAAGAAQSGPSGSAGAGASAGTVTVSDAWVKATAGTSDPSMAAAFGVLTNNSGKDVTFTSGTTSASARTELHEMATVDGAMVMRPVDGGITVPAHGSTTLAPGGLHVMMELTQPVQPGDVIDVTLASTDGTKLSFTATAKEFAGANEKYGGSSGAASSGMGSMAPSSGMGSMGGMDHGTTASSGG
ncbi:copper chaperone PCu(A)C [Nakamurella aerolata]|uniref:Copper chaperone PCu(A)C n=1 Tax=Nakamurella aerolata TaxID=1656892 RepID=A0A849A9W4_9ACTN|nr:copper chaperone PCu(A)C [Nakamurella aerolata]NNG36393.1 copper chaperone PCu(A)C [Nakamurella aerolata]